MDKEKGDCTEKLRQSAIKCWCLNQMIPAALTGMGSLIEKYVEKFCDYDGSGKFILDKNMAAQAGYNPEEVEEIIADAEFKMRSLTLGRYAISRLCSHQFWNPFTLDQICQRVKETLTESPGGILEGSVKFVFTMATSSEDFVIRMHYLEKL